MSRKILDPAKVVEVLNAEGCDITLEQYKSLIMAMTKIGVKRAMKTVAEVIGGKTYENLKVVESLVDEDEIDLRKSLRASLDRHLNLTYSYGRWFEDPAPKAEDTVNA